jgi:hypothetical protein
MKKEMKSPAKKSGKKPMSKTPKQSKKVGKY